MDRKDFLNAALRVGACCCAAALGVSAKLAGAQGRGSMSPDAAHAAWIPELERRMIQGAETPDWNKAEKAADWIKRLMDNMDAILDPETKVRLMQACGRACYTEAFGVAPEERPSLEAAQEAVRRLESAGNPVRREGDRTIITFNWGRDHQNPWGLIMRDGYCMCPVVETGPPGLSPTYCQCSCGYVREIFERSLGRPVKVEVLDSLKMGGQDCIFRVEIEGL
jgi:hypothetical protein